MPALCALFKLSHLIPTKSLWVYYYYCLLLLLFHFMKEKTEARTDRLGDMPRSQKGSAKVDI